LNERQNHRPIRSFVLRSGRLTPGQQRAFEEFWPVYGVDFVPSQALDLQDLFGNQHPVYLEIGFGNGESLAQMALAHPERNYLGIEVHPPGVGHLLIRLAELEIENLRIMQHDAIDILRQSIAPDSLAGVQLFFPDPWHKKKHQKRRIVQPEFVELLARAIRPGGLFHAASDWEHYARHILRVLSDMPECFSNAAGTGNYTPRPDSRPLTKFEQRGQRLGHGVWDLKFQRLANVDGE
jgi:tRNA (guanine-N7-)-methyltransferase